MTYLKVNFHTRATVKFLLKGKYTFQRYHHFVATLVAWLTSYLKIMESSTFCPTQQNHMTFAMNLDKRLSYVFRGNKNKFEIRSGVSFAICSCDDRSNSFACLSKNRIIRSQNRTQRDLPRYEMPVFLLLSAGYSTDRVFAIQRHKKMPTPLMRRVTVFCRWNADPTFTKRPISFCLNLAKNVSNLLP